MILRRVLLAFLAVVGAVLPTIALTGVAQASGENCLYANTGPGVYTVEHRFAYPTCGGNGTAIRSGDSNFGFVHIEIGGGRRTPTNHETTDFAMEQWQNAINQPASAQPSPGYYMHHWNYHTPSGTYRNMCVYVDTKSYEGNGQKGIITAYWITGTLDCPTSPND